MDTFSLQYSDKNAKKDNVDKKYHLFFFFRNPVPEQPILYLILITFYTNVRQVTPLCPVLKQWENGVMFLLPLLQVSL